MLQIELVDVLRSRERGEGEKGGEGGVSRERLREQGFIFGEVCPLSRVGVAIVKIHRLPGGRGQAFLGLLH